MKRLLSRQNLPEILISFILILLIFVPRIADLGLFLSHDEAMRNRQSLDSFQAIAEGRWGDVYSSNFGATNLTWARTAAKLLQYGWLRTQGVEVSLADMVNYGPKFDPLPGAVFNALLVVIAYWFIRRLFNMPTALLATALLALDPYLLSEARVLRTEAAFAVCMLLTLISIAIYARTYQRRYLMWSGFWAAWTIATKVSGVILLAMVGPILLAAAWNMHLPAPTLGRRVKRLSLDLLLWAGVTVVVTFAIWPTLWVKPLETLTELYNFVVDWGFQQQNVFFFMGQTVDNLPVSYYVLVLLYKTTPLVWLGLLTFGWLLWRSYRQKTKPGEVRWLGWPFPTASGLILLLSAAVYFAIMSRGPLKTERYMMSAVALLDVTAAVGLAVLGEWVYRRWFNRPQVKPFFWTATLLVFFVGQGLWTCLSHPYYFSYYNPLMGGGESAVKTIQIGSGEVLDEALAYLNNLPHPTRQVVVCGTNLPRCEYDGVGQKWLNRESLNPVNSSWVSADYVVTYIFHHQRDEYPPGVIDYLEKHPGPAYVARFQGIDYAKVYPAPHAQYVAASELTGISTLLGYTLNKQKLAAGDSLHLKLYWENDGHIERDMFVRLVDADDYIWAETTVPFASDFAGLEHQVGAIIEGQAELTLPVGIPPGQYYLKMGYPTADGKLAGLFKLPSGGDVVEVTLPATFVADSTWPHNLNLTVDPTLTLAGYILNQDKLSPGASLWLTLGWQTRADVKRDYVVNLRLLDATGNEAAYWLGRPVRSGYPTNQWVAGQFVQDPWRLTLPTDIQPGQYYLGIVLFDADTQQKIAQANLSMIVVDR